MALVVRERKLVGPLPDLLDLDEFECDAVKVIDRATGERTTAALQIVDRQLVGHELDLRQLDTFEGREVRVRLWTEPEDDFDPYDFDVDDDDNIEETDEDDDTRPVRQ